MTDVLYDDIPDLYDHELATIRTVWGALQRKYAHETNMADERNQERFIREAHGVFAENGFDVFVEFQLDVSDDPADMNLYYTPHIKLRGRVDHLKEFDHDRQKHEIRSGLLDGKTGVIDPNTGELKEDPKRKVIS